MKQFSKVYLLILMLVFLNNVSAQMKWVQEDVPHVESKKTTLCKFLVWDHGEKQQFVFFWLTRDKKEIYVRKPNAEVGLISVGSFKDWKMNSLQYTDLKKNKVSILLNEEGQFSHITYKGAKFHSLLFYPYEYKKEGKWYKGHVFELYGNDKFEKIGISPTKTFLFTKK